jgi:hypothetical protein
VAEAQFTQFKINDKSIQKCLGFFCPFTAVPGISSAVTDLRRYRQSRQVCHGADYMCVSFLAEVFCIGYYDWAGEGAELF